MIQRNYTIGRPELGPSVYSLNHFGSCPRKYNIEMIKQVLCYLKSSASSSKQIAIDSNPMEFERLEPNFGLLIPDFFEDYPEATEEIGPGFSAPYGPILETTILVDSDHAHDNKTRRPLIGLMSL